MSKKIKLKESVYILKEAENIYQVVFTSTRKIKRLQVDNLVKDIIDMTKSENDVSLIVDNLNERYSREDINLCINTLESMGVITRYTEDNINFRYQRQISFIDELTNSLEETLKIQKKLEDSTIAVFGVGGIGTWIVNGLYHIGIGNIRIVDPDIVKVSNLNRQLYFYYKDIGSYKVDKIKERISDANITTYKKFISQDADLEEIIHGCDFLVNCVDEPSVADTSRVISKYANAYGTPYSIAGGYNLHLGMVGPIIIPGESACFECFLEYQRENDLLSRLEKIKDIEQTGSLGPIAGAVANLHVMEIFKFLIGKGSINLNKFAEIDFMNFDIKWIQYHKRPNCSTCNQ